MSTKSNLIKNKRQKAVRAIDKGQVSEAVRLLLRLCQSYPKDVDSWFLLASAQGRQGNFQAALEAGQRALSMQPGRTDVLSVIGNAQACLGQYEQALESYRQALKTKPNDVGVLNNLGNALYLSGDLEEAADTYQKVIQRQPDYADAHNNLANVQKLLNRNDEAVHHFQQAIRLNPKLFEAYINLGNILSDRIAHPDYAEECFRKALKLKPDSLEAHAGVVNMLRFQGRLEDALEASRKALRWHPGNTTVLASEADIYERLGRHQEAYESARALTKGSDYPPLAVDLMTRLCRRYGNCDEAITLAERLLKGDQLTPAGRQMLHFGLGKLLDKLERYDQAFDHYHAGNEMTGVPFEYDAFKERIDAIVRTYSRVAMENLPRADHDSERPVYIVGMPRSGTSLMEQILSSHPEVFGAGELNDVNDLIHAAPQILGRRERYPECINSLTQATVGEMAKRYLVKLESLSAHARFVTDKMPHNFLNLGLIALMFPRAKVIHCVRDPIDTCLSIYFQNFGWLHPYAAKLEHLGQYYREYLRIMAHWEAVLDIPIMTVKYEEMVTHQEAMSREMIDFCGLEWDDACLQFHKSSRNVATASYDQVRQPIYNKSMERWKIYEQRLGPLIQALGS